MSKFLRVIVLVFLLLSVGAASFYFGFNYDLNSSSSMSDEDYFQAQEEDFSLHGKIISFENNVLVIEDSYGFDQSVELSNDADIIAHLDGEAFASGFDDLEPGRGVLIHLDSAEVFGGYSVDIYKDSDSLPEYLNEN